MSAHEPSAEPRSRTQRRTSGLAESPEETTMRRQDVELLGQCLAALQPEERHLISLHYLDGEPLELAGKRLGLSRWKTRSLHGQAMRRMRRFVRVGAEGGGKNAGC
jgi:RNA polymerase sigma factor (sigma-70 family)